MDPGTVFGILEAPGKLINAAIALKKLYDAFFDEHRNATTEAREFAQLVTTFSINLVNQGRLIRRAGKFFPGEQNFKRTIQQCAQYLRGYETLLREQAHPVRTAVDIARWQSDLNGDRKALVDKLNTHINFMNSFSMNVLLEIALRDREGIQPAPTPVGESAAVREEQTLKKFEGLYNELYGEIVRMQNRQKRDRRYELAPDLVTADLKKIIDQWRSILINSGMSENRLPTLPVLSEHDTINSIIYHWRRDIAREQSLHSRSPSEGSRASSGTPRSTGEHSGAATPVSRRPSLDPDPDPRFFPDPSPHPEQDSLFHSPIDNLYAAQRSPQSIVSTRPDSVWSPEGTIGSQRTDRTSLSLDSRRPSQISFADSFGRLSVSDARPIGEVRWQGQHQHSIKLYTRDVDDPRRPRSIIWNMGKVEQLEHTLGKSVHPFTKHSSLKRPMEVSFFDEQELKNRKHYKASPVYTFYDETDYRTFQSIVYRRYLLETFDVEKISSSTSSRQGEAMDQHVKLWKSMESERHYLTFYGNALEPPKYRQLLVTWFERPIPNESTNTRPSIRLTVRKRSRTPSGPPRRLSGFGLGHGPKTRTSSVSSHSQAENDGRRASVATNHDDAHACPEEILRMGHLDLHFAKLEERNNFVAAFIQALDGTLSGPPHSPSTAKYSPTIPEHPAERDIPDDARSVISIANTESSFSRLRATPSSLLGLRPPV